MTFKEIKSKLSKNSQFNYTWILLYLLDPNSGYLLQKQT